MLRELVAQANAPRCSIIEICVALFSVALADTLIGVFAYATVLYILWYMVGKIVSR